MPKFSMDINGASQGAAQGREAWAGEHPPTGSYEGILKVVQVQKISDTATVVANRGKPKLSIGVELVNTPEGKYDGYIAWSNLNLVDSAIPYINQFLIALTDGSDAQFDAIKKAFYAGFVTDDRKIHVTAIGKWKIGSPEGTIPIKVSLKKRGYIPNGSQETVYISDINSFLLGGGGANVGAAVAAGPQVDEVEEETVGVELEDESGEVFAEEETADA